MGAARKLQSEIDRWVVDCDSLETSLNHQVCTGQAMLAKRVSVRPGICWSQHSTGQQHRALASFRVACLHHRWGVACSCRCLKKVQEGIDEFDQIWDKVGSSVVTPRPRRSSSGSDACSRHPQLSLGRLQ